MVDLEALAAAGVQNVHERRPLIEYLAGLGLTEQQMIEAERQGRLFALGGDVFVASGPSKYSLRTAAEAVGRRLDEIEHVWAVLGLTVADADHVALTDADVEGLKTWSELDRIIGPDIEFAILRVMGASMRRYAEAISSAVRAGLPDINMGYTFDELKTAQAYTAIASYVPRTGAFLDAVYRQHLQSARVHLEGVMQDIGTTAVCGVGFVDLSGFTALSRQLSPAELSVLLSMFTETVSDVVHADGGRVVKFIGDAVMWVSSSAQQLAVVAADLVEHTRAREHGLQVRAGLAFGPALVVDGDYYGETVNLAARLVAAAQPGEVVAASSVADRLAGWHAEPTEPLVLRGFDEAVIAHKLSRPQTSE